MSVQTNAPAPQIAYLVSQYPATSHTFILREVIGLRRGGMRIVTASINADLRPLATLTTDEQEERQHTYVIKHHGVAGALVAHIAALLRHPLGYWRGLRAAGKRSIINPRKTLLNLFHFTEALMIGRWMRKQHTTHLHVHFATAAASVASLAKQVFPMSLSMTVHGPDEFANVQDEHFAEKVQAADFVVCISNFARSQTMQHSSPANWGKLEVARLGVDPSLYAAARKSTAAAPFTMLCVGRLTPAKGQHLLLEAMARLRERGEQVQLVLVGDGPDRVSLQALAQQLQLEEIVTFCGALNQDEVKAAYQRCDAFVLPSFAEGIPVVLMEAMAFGLPCVSTRIAGIPELITDGENGFLTSPSDIEDLVSRLHLLINDPELRARLGASGRARVCDAYNLDTNITLLDTVFRRRLGAM
jgi:colanic acid/amylovoran biosynthesis glycosyltransferase